MRQGRHAGGAVAAGPLVAVLAVVLACTTSAPPTTEPSGSPAQTLTPETSVPSTTATPRGTPVGDPTDAPTSMDLIDEALASGTIDEQTAVTYKLYHLFGDDRLPPAYATVLDPQGDEGESFLRALRAGYDDLSLDMQAVVGPYLVQPFYEGSWWDLQHSADRSGRTLAAQPGVILGVGLSEDPAVPTCTPAIGDCSVSAEWTSITTNNGKVRIWYPTAMPGGATQAGRARSDIDTILWPELTQAMGREPKNDEGFANNGVDGLIDIAIVDGEVRSHVEQMGPGFASCQDAAGYMVLAPYDRLVLAHEFMHLIEFAFPVQGDQDICFSWDWIDEGVSNWATKLVYPNEEYGHPSGRRFINQLEFTLNFNDDTREYGTWLFWLYLSKSYGTGIIGDIYEARASDANSLKAVDRTIPGGFEERWREFALYAWNRDPITEFQDWDGFEASAESSPPRMDLDGDVDQLIELESLVLEPLSAWHLHFEVPDEVRSLGFYNGLAYALEELATEPGSILAVSPDLPDSTGLHINALLKVNGSWQEPQDWTLMPYRNLCTDAPSERVEEIVLIFSNSAFADPTRKLKAQNLPTTLFASNFACARWEGEITSTYTDENGSETVTGRGLVFERDPSQVSPVGGGYNVYYLLTSGRIDWEYDFTYAECTERGAGSGLRVVPHHAFGTINWFISGAWYRASSASIEVEVEPLITLRCPNEPDVTSAHFVVLSFPLEAGQVEDDGSTISGTYRDGGWEVTWHLEAIRP
ncbi:MAG: hypothetical protein ABI797_03880 [Chloroflexota bacterium]